MDDKHRVLIAEDDGNLRDLLQLMFENDFILHFAETGDFAVKLLQQHEFDFAILDINLPNKNGLEICEFIRDTDLQRKPSIAILSADNSAETVKRAYQLGVNDYICKPFDVTVFHERILHFSKILMSASEAPSKPSLMEADSIQAVAETAMAQAASYGAAMSLMEALNKVQTEAGIAKEVLTYFLSDGLHAALQLRNGDKIHTFDVDGTEVSTVELQVFEVLHNSGRIYQFGHRTIFNDTHTSILIKNMPENGCQKYDAVLDVIAKLVPAIDARYLSICDRHALLEARNALSTVMSELAIGLNDMEQEKQQLLEAVALKISLSFHKLDMEEEQEQYFIDLIENELKQKENSDHFYNLQGLISNCMAGLEREIQETTETEEAEEEKPAETDNMDIELF